MVCCCAIPFTASGPLQTRTPKSKGREPQTTRRLQITIIIIITCLSILSIRVSSCLAVFCPLLMTVQASAVRTYSALSTHYSADLRTTSALKMGRRDSTPTSDTVLQQSETCELFRSKGASTAVHRKAVTHCRACKDE